MYTGIVYKCISYIVFTLYKCINVLLSIYEASSASLRRDFLKGFFPCVTTMSDLSLSFWPSQTQDTKKARRFGEGWICRTVFPSLKEHLAFLRGPQTGWCVWPQNPEGEVLKESKLLGSFLLQSR